MCSNFATPLWFWFAIPHLEIAVQFSSALILFQPVSLPSLQHTQTHLPNFAIEQVRLCELNRVFISIYLTSHIFCKFAHIVAIKAQLYLFIGSLDSILIASFKQSLIHVNHMIAQSSST